MDKHILNGLKFGFGIFLSLGILFGIVFAVGFHTASEVLPGIFQGDYTFNGSLNLTEGIVVSNFNLTPAVSKTYYINNSMTTDEIQEVIDSVPKYVPTDSTVTLQFQNGEYNLDNQFFWGEEK
jgi:hypothetical protein